MAIDSYARKLWVMWLALPLTALNYWVSWKHLPARIAMHYDPSGRPTSWASPYEAWTFSITFLFFMLLALSAVGVLVSAMRPDRAKPAVVLLGIVAGLVGAFLNGFVWFNIAG